MSIEEQQHMGWCAYCKDCIHEDDPYVEFEGGIYHLECIKQMNTFYDPFED